MVAAIWAQSLDGIIGNGTSMPWHLPEDLHRFQRLTSGHPVVMGRRTWESLPQRFRPLPGRPNYVLSTRTPGQWSAGAQVCSAFPHWLDDAWVIGGERLYQEFLPLFSRIFITLIDARLSAAIGAAAVRAPSLPEDVRTVEDSGWQDSLSGKLLVPGPPHRDDSPSGPLRYRFLTYQLRREEGEMSQPVTTVFMTTWCPYCHRLLRDLSATGLAYRTVDVDHDPDAAAWVESVNGGNRVVPTVRFANGTSATNPSAQQVVATAMEISGDA